MERIEPIGNVLVINNWLRELAIEYGITDYIIRGSCTGGIYTAFMRWHHTIKYEIANIAISVALKTLDAQPWMDTYKYAQSVLAMKQRRSRQYIVDIIMECGSVQ